jgi:hypothetical protein
MPTVGNMLFPIDTREVSDIYIYIFDKMTCFSYFFWRMRITQAAHPTLPNWQVRFKRIPKIVGKSQTFEYTEINLWQLAHSTYANH